MLQVKGCCLGEVLSTFMNHDWAALAADAMQTSESFDDVKLSTHSGVLNNIGVLEAGIWFQGIKIRNSRVA
jgi:hypothetical protein